ncbi:MAG: FkbM family methyltransferase [Verrucomicrobiota bacterium]
MKFIKSFINKLPQGWQERIRKWHYARKLRSATLEDEAELGVVELLVKPGQTVLDIGANFGLFTRFLSEAVGAKGHVFSFEPTNDMFAVLEHNIQALNFANVTASKLALSDAAGRSTIYIPRRADGTLNHYEASVELLEGMGDIVEDEIEQITLDQFCKARGIEAVDFIKCDVEGHELAVLAGGKNFFTSCRPPILLEVNEPLDDGGHGSQVRELVEALGYTIHTCSGAKIVPWKAGEVRVNYLLLPPERAAELSRITA